MCLPECMLTISRKQRQYMPIVEMNHESIFGYLITSSVYNSAEICTNQDELISYLNSLTVIT